MGLVAGLPPLASRRRPRHHHLPFRAPPPPSPRSAGATSNKARPARTRPHAPSLRRRTVPRLSSGRPTLVRQRTLRGHEEGHARPSSASAPRSGATSKIALTGAPGLPVSASQRRQRAARSAAATRPLATSSIAHSEHRLAAVRRAERPSHVSSGILSEDEAVAAREVGSDD